MNKFSIKPLQASSTVLTVLGIAGTVATAVLAAKETPKALALVENRKHELGTDDIPVREAVMASWRCYAPTVLMGAATSACIIGIGILDRKSQASLSSAYAMLNESYKRYRQAANTVYGENADKRIQAAAAKDAYISADGCALYSADMDPDSEKILFYDTLSKRYFMSTMAAVLNCQYHINRNLQLKGQVSLNDFYEFLGIDGVDHGDEMAWSMDTLLDGGIMWLDFENAKTVMDDGLECCVVSPLFEPEAVCGEDLDI